jgi:CRISPR-associated protein Cas1
MADHRILLIENPARLSIDHGRIKIEREGQEAVFAAPTDIAILCLHHHTINLSVHVLKALAAAGAAVLVTDDQHHPSALMVPVAGNQALLNRLEQQIAVRESKLTHALWTQLVCSKVRTQAANLRFFELNGALRLERLVEQVKPGDPSNVEAQAARHYWKYFFGNDFTRRREGAEDGLNARLNYGYAVLRALVARQLVMNGLNTALGLGHKGRQNPFNLADDFTEPFRYLVERHVRSDEDVDAPFTSQVKVGLLRFMEQEVPMGEATYRVASAVAESVGSFCRALEQGRGELRLP